jgi:serine/threonine-protein kinase
MTHAVDPLFIRVQRALAGEYSLERELGRGGIAVVYLAREVELDRRVALKVLLPGAHDDERRARFLREARTAAALSHPHIVPIFRVGEADRLVYFAMPYIEGETLGVRLRSHGPLSTPAATQLVREVAQALGYAHARGFVHRDVKPDNIMVERRTGRALVMDFGVAAAAREQPADLAGTIHFMSPEQAAGSAVDARSDVYALGVVAHLAFTGKLPRLEGAGESESPSSAPRVAAGSGLPAWIGEVIGRALAQTPGERFPAAELFADALEARGPAHPPLPLALRAWLGSRNPLLPIYLIWSGIAGIAGILEMIDGGLDDARLPLLLALLPVVPAVLFRARHAARVFRAGYTVDDLRVALAARIEEGETQRASRQRGTVRWVHGIARLGAWSAVALTVRALNSTNPIGNVWLVSLGFVALPVLTALGIPLLPPRFSAASRSLRAWFWNSRCGRLAERLLRGTSRSPAPDELFRPTEVMLGGAVVELFDALPAAYRESLADLPRVVERLREHAARARAALIRLDDAAPVGLGRADLAAARERALRQLTESVSALETVRLGVLRLQAGACDLPSAASMMQTASAIDARLNEPHDSAPIRRQKRLDLDLREVTPV